MRQWSTTLSRTCVHPFNPTAASAAKAHNGRYYYRLLLLRSPRVVHGRLVVLGGTECHRLRAPH